MDRSKNDLQEYCAKNRIEPPKYTEEMNNDKKFRSTVVVNGISYISGWQSKKIEAQKEAALIAWEDIQKNIHVFSKNNNSNNSNNNKQPEKKNSNNESLIKNTSQFIQSSGSSINEAFYSDGFELGGQSLSFRTSSSNSLSSSGSSGRGSSIDIGSNSSYRSIIYSTGSSGSNIGNSSSNIYEYNISNNSSNSSYNSTYDTVLNQMIDPQSSNSECKSCSNIDGEQSEGCIAHYKSFEFYCYDCEKVLCKYGLFDQHKDHKSDIIERIRSGLQNILKGTVKNNNNKDITGSPNSSMRTSGDSSCGAGFLKSRMDFIWSKAKKLSQNYSTLTNQWNDVHNFYDIIHRFLITNEQRVIKPIVSDMEQIKVEIDSYIQELKSIISIIKLNEHCYSKDDGNEFSNSNGDHIERLEDRTENYTPETIIGHINTGIQLDKFIELNSNTLFYFDTHSINSNNNQYNHSINFDMHILNAIRDHIQKYQQNRISTPIDKEYYYKTFDIKINNDSLGVIKDIARQSISLSTISSKIFSINSDNRSATLIEIDGYSNIDKTIIEFNCSGGCETINSLVTVGDKLYMFNQDKNTIFTPSNNKIAPWPTIQDNVVSACFDGSTFIYLLCRPDGIGGSSKLLRYNIIDDSKAYFCTRFKDKEYMTYSNGMLYITGYRGLDISLFDPQEHKIEPIYSNNQFLSYSISGICSDNERGEIYFYLVSPIVEKFVKIDLKSKQIKELATIDGRLRSRAQLSMLFYKRSENERKIYLFGQTHGNHIYSIENNQWIRYENDQIPKCSSTYAIIYNNSNVSS